MSACIAALMLSVPAAQAERSSAAVSEWPESGSVRPLARVLSGVEARSLGGSETCTYAQHRFLMNAVRHYSWKIRVWENKMGAGVAQSLRAPDSACPRFYARWLRLRAYALHAQYERWQRERRAYFRRLYEKFRCIHEHEGAWNAHNPPYHGGLQFDDTFQRQYGPEFMRRWGGAENWPVYAQLIAAERAYHGFHGYAARYFTPWPNTARMCGLL